MPRDQYHRRENVIARNRSRRGRARRVAASMAAALVAPALIAAYFHTEVAAYLTSFLDDDESRITEDVERQLTKSAALLREVKAAQAITAKPQLASEETQARAAVPA